MMAHPAPFANTFPPIGLPAPARHLEKRPADDDEKCRVDFAGVAKGTPFSIC
jgi:hypothetical protein